MFLSKVFSRNLKYLKNFKQNPVQQVRYNVSFMQKNKKSLEELATESANNPAQNMKGMENMDPNMNPTQMQDMIKKTHEIGEQTEQDNKNMVNDAVDDLYRQQQEEELEHEKQIQIMHERHRQLQTELDSELDLPFKLYGWLDVPETNTAYMGERVFAQHRIPKHQVLNHLYKIFTGTLYSLAESDSEFLHEYCERQFADKLLKSVSQLKEKGYKFKVVEDVTGLGGEPISKFYYISDMVLVRGLDVDREKNLPLQEYHEYKDIDDMGIAIYTPLSLSNPENFVDPEQNETIYDPYKKVVMRCLVPIRTPLRLQVFKDGEGDDLGKQILVEDDLYTWEHVAVFETQMNPPEKFKSFYKLENYMEWLGKFKFGTWKLVDLDNWMEGNPLITKGTKRELYSDPIFQGSKYDHTSNVSIRNI